MHPQFLYQEGITSDFRRFPRDFSSRISHKHLNAAQYSAVTYGEGPLLVLAGAGTGKTRTLVYRLAYLLEQGVRPASILLLTFRRLAAQEMIDRAALLVGEVSSSVHGGTFHSIALRYLRMYGEELGFSRGFTVLDTQKSERVIKQVRDKISAPPSRAPSNRILYRLLSLIENKGMSIEAYILQYAPRYSKLIGYLYALFEAYSQYKQAHNLMDYDDLLFNFERLLLNDSEGILRSRYRYVLVDEYQDMNRVQAAIAQQLVQDHQNITAVGDEAQAVYGWRGGDVSHILKFDHWYPGAHTIRLLENYRSCQPVLDLSNRLIPKSLVSAVSSSGPPPVFHEARNEFAEADYVVSLIRVLLGAGADPGGIAVLYRSSYHAAWLENGLRKNCISYEKRGGVKITETAHATDVLSFFRLTLNAWDRLSWLRVLQMLPGVGPVAANKLFSAVKGTEQPFKALGAIKPPRVKVAVFNRFTGLLRRLSTISEPVSFFAAVLEYYEPYFAQQYEENDPLKRRDELAMLRKSAAEYATLQDFVDSVTLEPGDQDGGTMGGIILSTVHSAQGLQFDTVFVVGCSEGRFTSSRSDPEDDKRLLYVAITRAKQNLYITYPREFMTPDHQHISGGLVGYFS